MKLLSALFSSKESYLGKIVKEHNEQIAFPEKEVALHTFVEKAKNDHMLISGGTDCDRARVIIPVVKEALSENYTVVVVHSGNAMLNTSTFRTQGVYSVDWNEALTDGLSLAEFLTMMSGDEHNELVPFWVWAYQVMEALGKTTDIYTLAEINWFEMGWQQDLLAQGDLECAMDLLARYDREMSKYAAKAMVICNQLCRSGKRNKSGWRLGSAMGKPVVICAELRGGQSSLAKKYLDAIHAEIDSGNRIMVILDNTYPENHALLKCESQNVRIVISSADICSYGVQLNSIIRTSKSAIIFRHTFAESAETLSNQLFGQYDRVQIDYSLGKNTERNGSFTQCNSGISTHIRRTYRLDPLRIMQAPDGVGFIRSSGIEGCVLL